MTDLEPLVLHESHVDVRTWSDDIRGHLSFRTLFGDSTRAANSLSAGVATLQSGQWLGKHRHTATETYFVLAGAGVMTLGAIDHVVHSGHAIFIPGGTEHGIRNTGADALRFFYAFDVGAFDNVAYEYPGVDY